MNMPLSESELTSIITDYNGCIRITCRVQPRSSRSKIMGLFDGALKVALTAPPVDGKANAALCEFFASLFRCPKSSVSVVSGMTAKNKIVEVAGTGASAARSAVCANCK